jgi:hypothetical protein
LALHGAVNGTEVERVIEIIFLEFPVSLDVDVVANQELLIGP